MLAAQLPPLHDASSRMELMDLQPKFRGAGAAGRVALCLATALCLCAGACKKTQRTDMTPLEQAGMWSDSVEELRQAKLTADEIKELVLVHNAGFGERECIELVRIAHARQQPLSGGETIASLASAGFGVDSVLQLARMNQLGLWAGEAQGMRLAGLPDAVVLAVAKRRAARQPTLDGAKLAALQNAGLTHAEIIALIDRGATNAEADEIVTRRNYAAGGHSFVHQRGRRR
jgi:hypothetical protein